ncbi:MAG: hypothetical protein M0C28_08285 [Candidatus Moduliflexus flocculans]|nr:hypothetical protein [Candidatus Moduliflexus flocculans]
MRSFQKQYKQLFSEGRIGQVTLRNRVVLPPLEVGMANFDGTPSEQLISYYEERARNGLGLLITGITRVNEHHGAGLPRQLAMTSDRHIEPFARMVERLHVHGTKVFCQLHHPGRQSNSLMIGALAAEGTDRSRLARLLETISSSWYPPLRNLPRPVWFQPWWHPSAVACEYSKQKTRALSKREVREPD